VIGEIIAMVAFALIVIFCVAGFAMDRLIGTKGRIDLRYYERERQAEWEQEHPE
jgi:hypothetical protein